MPAMRKKKDTFTQTQPESLADFPELSVYAEAGQRAEAHRQHLITLKGKWGFAEIDFDTSTLFTNGECERLVLRVDHDEHFNVVYQAAEQYELPRREVGSDWCDSPAKALSQLVKKLEAERKAYEKSLTVKKATKPRKS